MLTCARRVFPGFAAYRREAAAATRRVPILTLAPVPRPEGAAGTFVFDGACGFCRRWVDWLERRTDGAVTFVPYQGIDDLAVLGLTLGDVRTAHNGSTAGAPGGAPRPSLRPSPTHDRHGPSSGPSCVRLSSDKPPRRRTQSSPATATACPPLATDETASGTVDDQWRIRRARARACLDVGWRPGSTGGHL